MGATDNGQINGVGLSMHDGSSGFSDKVGFGIENNQAIVPPEIVKAGSSPCQSGESSVRFPVQDELEVSSNTSVHQFGFSVAARAFHQKVGLATDLLDPHPLGREFAHVVFGGNLNFINGVAKDYFCSNWLDFVSAVRQKYCNCLTHLDTRRDALDLALFEADQEHTANAEIAFRSGFLSSLSKDPTKSYQEVQKLTRVYTELPVCEESRLRFEKYETRTFKDSLERDWKALKRRYDDFVYLGPEDDTEKNKRAKEILNNFPTMPDGVNQTPSTNLAQNAPPTVPHSPTWSGSGSTNGGGNNGIQLDCGLRIDLEIKSKNRGFVDRNIDELEDEVGLLQIYECDEGEVSPSQMSFRDRFYQEIAKNLNLSEEQLDQAFKMALKLGLKILASD